MRNAYLIISHNEFDILRILVHSLDNERNDIYVHIDKKVKQLPEIDVKHCRLFFLQDRMDVRWGNVSQIKAEILLFEKAHENGSYDFYHLISGTHLPLKNQDEIDSFFGHYNGKCIFSNLEMRNGDYQEVLKLHRINICTRWYASPNKVAAQISQLLWKTCIAIQRWLNITVNNGVQFYWANNWCSLSQDAVDYLLSIRSSILRRYRWSFCGDEWFVPTELMASPLKENVINSDHLLCGTIVNSHSFVLKLENAEAIINSDCCFGRKFTCESSDLIDFLKINE